MSTDPKTTDRPPARDGSAGAPTAPPSGGPRPAPPAATVTVAQRRATDIRSDDVIAIPDEVFVAVPARVGGRRTWMWRSKPSRLLANAHRWRWVYDVDELDEDDSGLAASLPLGFRLFRVSDDHPDQGQEYRSLTIAVREYDLIDIQLRAGPDHGQQPDGRPADTNGEADYPERTDVSYQDFPVRDARLRVFDRSTDVGSDDASDMYVLDVFAVSVLVRLRTTRTHPATRPQLYVHIDNEDREPTDLAVEVSTSGETHYRI